MLYLPSKPQKITSSTDSAIIEARRELGCGVPIIHIVTDDFEQVVYIMEKTFFGREPASALYLPKDGKWDDNTYYFSLNKLSRQAGADINWIVKAVYYVTPEKLSDGCYGISDVVTDRIKEYIAQKTMCALSGCEEKYIPRSCVVLGGRELNVPDFLEAYTATIKTAPLNVSDFELILKEKYGLEKNTDGGLAKWYENNLSGFTEKEILAVFDEIAYGDPASLKIRLQDRKYAERIISREKNKRLNRHGKLTSIPVCESQFPENCPNIKNWLDEKKANITRIDVTDSADITKGLLLIGLPGTGKSMIAKGIAAELELPLVQLEISRVLGSYVGESEKNMKEVLDDLLIAGAPCVLWLDEVEKMFSGSNGQSGDSGVMQRLFGALLNFMQEMKKTIFIVATANDISKFPPEFSRSGRFDEVYRLMLPSYTDCITIMKRKLEHHFGKSKTVNYNDLAKGLIDAASEGIERKTPVRFFTGADITKLSNELCLKLGGLPGKGKADALKNRDKVITMMREIGEKAVVTLNTTVFGSSVKTAAQYIVLVESQAAYPNDSDVRIEFDPKKKEREILQPSGYEKLLPYDKALFDAIKSGIEEIISKNP